MDAFKVLKLFLRNCFFLMLALFLNSVFRNNSYFFKNLFTLCDKTGAKKKILCKYEKNANQEVTIEVTTEAFEC